MKAVPVSAAADAGTELHLFGNRASEDGVEFGLKAFFIVEEAPWVEHVDGCSEAGFRVSVSEFPQTIAFLDSLPCWGYDMCDAPKMFVAKPD